MTFCPLSMHYHERSGGSVGIRAPDLGQSEAADAAVFRGVDVGRAGQ